jgi:hypothetical protein
MVAPFIQQSDWARLVFGISLAAFAVGEFSQAVKWRRGASRADLRGEVAFRIVFFAGILMLPLAQTLAPGAVSTGVGPFVSGMAIGWLASCWDGGRSSRWGSTSQPW